MNIQLAFQFFGERVGFAFADEFFWTRHAVQNVLRFGKRGLKLAVLRLAEEHVDFERFTVIAQTGGAADPAIGFVENRSGIDEIEGDGFVDVPDCVLPGMLEFVVVICSHNALGREGWREAALFQSFAEYAPDILVIPARCSGLPA